MKIMVTGGAGYIGSVVTEYLINKGNEVVVLDNLSTGHKDAVDDRARFIKADLLDTSQVREILLEGCEAVCHFAAFSQVSESMSRPIRYYRNNVCGAVSLLEAMRDAGVSLFLFSSTAAVYGEPREVPITEDSPTVPVNPYGRTKLAIEGLLEDCAAAWGLKALYLRYFNAAGATRLHGEDHRPESHLIPLALDAAEGKREELVVFGDDYPTGDGTCVRDYIHVKDLASAHVLGLDRLAGGLTGPLNLGNGRGFSVLEVIEAVSRVTGLEVPYQMGKRRTGDPAVLVASSKRSEELLGWRREYPELDRIIEDAYNWRRSFSEGYEK